MTPTSNPQGKPDDHWRGAVVPVTAGSGVVEATGRRAPSRLNRGGQFWNRAEAQARLCVETTRRPRHARLLPHTAIAPAKDWGGPCTPPGMIQAWLTKSGRRGQNQGKKLNTFRAVWSLISIPMPCRLPNASAQQVLKHLQVRLDHRAAPTPVQRATLCPASSEERCLGGRAPPVVAE